MLSCVVPMGLFALSTFLFGMLSTALDTCGATVQRMSLTF